ncbi:MAG: alkaline phosphatase family protein, partial [Armatimonadota bacterium]
MAARLLVLGIDGASPGWVAGQIAAGELPELARIQERGCYGPLRSTPNMLSPSAWTSMVTGVNPGKHGIFGFFDRVPGTYRFRPSDARARAADPWWVLASRAGLRTLTLNVPCSWPADAVNGVLVAGWLTPSPRVPGFTHPADLATDLAARFGAYPLHSDVQRLAAARRWDRLRARVVGNLRRKAQIACHLLARERWDLMTVVFTDTDAAQHYCWHLTDRAHPEHDARLRAATGDVVLAAYQELDRALPCLLAAADPDVLLIVSDHGCGPNGRAHLLLPELLEARGWQVRRGEYVSRLCVAAQSLLPAGLKHRLGARRLGGRWDAVSRLLVGGIVWPRTRAFTAVFGGRADLWLNIIGREPQGALAAADCPGLCAALQEALLGWRHPQSGEALVAALHHRDALYRGPQLSLAPDLLVQWQEDIKPVVGRRGAPEAPQTGAHRREGLLLAAGAGIRRGEVSGAAVEDIMPTVLHLCGLPVPGYCDGRVLSDLLAEPPDVRIDADAY